MAKRKINVPLSEIEGVEFDPKHLFEDERGWLCPLWAAGEGPIEAKSSFASWTRRTTVVRGLHCQRGQDKLVTVLSGRIFDVLVDARPDSPTYRAVAYMMLTVGESVFVPDGVLHGFQVVEPPALVHYEVNVPYKPEDYVIVNALDPMLDIPWPFPVAKGTRSEQDELARPFGEEGATWTAL